MSHKPGTGVRKDRLAAIQPWLQQTTLLELYELNQKSLELFQSQALVGAPGDAPMIVEIRDLWFKLDPAALRLAAEMPFSLVDAGFDNARRWEAVAGNRVHDQSPPVSFFTVARARDVSRLVLTFAWHLVRGQISAARLLLGMSSECIELVSACSLNQITVLSERYPEWLEPRWANHVEFWRDLLRAASHGDTAMLRQLRDYGMQLLAADLRLAASR